MSVFSQENIYPIITKLEKFKTPGTDEMHPFVLNKCPQVFSWIFSLLFKKSFKEGKIPQKWKEANICPLYKKGSKSDPSNYRPVSLSAVPCKIMEKIIRD